MRLPWKPTAKLWKRSYLAINRNFTRQKREIEDLKRDAQALHSMLIEMLVHLRAAAYLETSPAIRAKEEKACTEAETLLHDLAEYYTPQRK